MGFYVIEKNKRCKKCNQAIAKKVYRTLFIGSSSELLEIELCEECWKKEHKKRTR